MYTALDMCMWFNHSTISLNMNKTNYLFFKVFISSHSVTTYIISATIVDVILFDKSYEILLNRFEQTSEWHTKEKFKISARKIEAYST